MAHLFLWWPLLTVTLPYHSLPFLVTWPSGRSLSVPPLPGKPESNMLLNWQCHTWPNFRLLGPASLWVWGLHAHILQGTVGEPKPALYSVFQPQGHGMKQMKYICSDPLLYPCTVSYCGLQLGLSHNLFPIPNSFFCKSETKESQTS